MLNLSQSACEMTTNQHSHLEWETRANTHGHAHTMGAISNATSANTNRVNCNYVNRQFRFEFTSLIMYQCFMHYGQLNFKTPIIDSQHIQLDLVEFLNSNIKFRVIDVFFSISFRWNVYQESYFPSVESFRSKSPSLRWLCVANETDLEKLNRNSSPHANASVRVERERVSDCISPSKWCIPSISLTNNFCWASPFKVELMQFYSIVESHTLSHSSFHCKIPILFNKIGSILWRISIHIYHKRSFIITIEYWSVDSRLNVYSLRQSQQLA